MFPRKSTDKQNFIEQTKAARLERERDKKSNQSATVIQALVRGFITRRKIRREILVEFDSVVQEWDDRPHFVESIKVYHAVAKLLFVFNEVEDRKRFERMNRYIIESMILENEDAARFSYVSVAISKSYTVKWIQQLKSVLWQICVYLKQMRSELQSDAKSIMLYLNMLVTFTNSHSWNLLKTNDMLRQTMNQLCNNVITFLVAKGLMIVLKTLLIKGLCKNKPSLKRLAFSSIITISLRPLILTNYSESQMNIFFLHILSVPGLIYHQSNIVPETLLLLSNHLILKRTIDVLKHEQNTRILFNVLEGNYALCLLANIIHLSFISSATLKEHIMDLVLVYNRILESCQKYVVNKQSSLTHWHPILGWFAQNVDQGLHESLVYVKVQLQYLWSPQMILIMFDQLIEYNDSQNHTHSQYKRTSATSDHQLTIIPTNPQLNEISSSNSGFFRKAMDRAGQVVSKGVGVNVGGSFSGSNVYRKLGSHEVTKVALICAMFETVLSTLTQMKLDILTGLCYQDLILPNLWKFICSLGNRCGLTAFLDHLALNTKICAPEFQIINLFCDCASHTVTILDDMELYEQQKPFSVDDLIAISSFLNNFVFKIIWNNLIDMKNATHNPLLNSTHILLMILYKRDCRRNYAPTDHWLIKELKVSAFMKDLENGKKTSQLLMQKVPHIIPHKERVILFRKYVSNEKTVLGLTESACASPQSTLITVNRLRIVEDGYQQLAVLPPQSLKGVIRVRFINEQGLDEAGIDQDGVFKEFLEETIKRIFDPSLNLFKVTTEQRLYPSPTSNIHENHLSLFEFVGKMLGKAVYEGIVVDVPFASFFLSQVLGQQQSALYSSIDELPSLDAELYKSLTYIKHYNGDVSQLDLTFSIDEDCMGEVVTHELVSGGRAIPVTNETRISYIHLVAHFKMHVQVHEQTAAFIRGFRSIVNPDFLSIFSTPELQRLISGDNTPVDLQDLRRHTKYYGGFHNSHRVINWLWDILEKDYDPEEHRLFLKFVTSCSKPPLLGFAHLEPPFSIRCVEVSDDQDVGDTVGSVLRGFFTIRRKDPVNRLPTSSTCFNLLKLPNYQKKSTLRDKLRYAIRSNTGFELS